MIWVLFEVLVEAYHRDDLPLLEQKQGEHTPIGLFRHAQSQWDDFHRKHKHLVLFVEWYLHPYLKTSS